MQFRSSLNLLRQVILQKYYESKEDIKLKVGGEI